MASPKPKLDLDIGRLRQVLDYDPSTGILFWRINTRSAKRVCGQAAGYVGNRGYVKIMIDGQYWLAHRLAWAHVHDVFPKPPLQIDHINRIRHDNRLANLRAVTHYENAMNSSWTGHRLAETLGATFIKRIQKWQAQISINGQNIYLGVFSTQAEAYAAYCSAKKGATP